MICNVFVAWGGMKAIDTKGIGMAQPEKIILDLCGGTGAWSNPYAEEPVTPSALVVAGIVRSHMGRWEVSCAISAS